MCVDLFREFLGDGRDGEGVLHAAVIRVGGWEEVFVGMDGLIVEELVAQLGAELGEETVGDQGRRGSIDAGFTLGRMLAGSKREWERRG
jgi:hypothetical protein